MVEFWPTGWSQAEGTPFLDTTTPPYKIEREQTHKGSELWNPLGRGELRSQMG